MLNWTSVNLLLWLSSQNKKLASAHLYPASTIHKLAWLSQHIPSARPSAHWWSKKLILYLSFHLVSVEECIFPFPEIQPVNIYYLREVRCGPGNRDFLQLQGNQGLLDFPVNSFNAMLIPQHRCTNCSKHTDWHRFGAWKDLGSKFAASQGKGNEHLNLLRAGKL